MLLFRSCVVFCQSSVETDESKADYLRFPHVPMFTLLKGDGTSFTDKDVPQNKKLLVMFFSTDCGFCQVETDSIKVSMTSLDQVEIVMVTFDTQDKITTFEKTNDLLKYKNLVVGRDVKYFFIPFYEITATPFLALYDSNGKYLTSFRGIVPIRKIIDSFKSP